MTAVHDCVVNLDPPAEPRHNDLLCGIQRWKATGYGINPNQPALRHQAHSGSGICRCHWCVGTPIVTTEMFSWP